MHHPNKLNNKLNNKELQEKNKMKEYKKDLLQILIINKTFQPQNHQLKLTKKRRIIKKEQFERERKEKIGTQEKNTLNK